MATPRDPRGARSKAQRTHLERQRALDALDLMRNREFSATAATRHVGITLSTLLRVARAALRKENDRWLASAFDRIPRTLPWAEPTGMTLITVRSSKQASLIASHHAAMRRYVRTSDLSVLLPFMGLTIRVGTETHTFLTDPPTIERLAYAGELDYHEFYNPPPRLSR